MALGFFEFLELLMIDTFSIKAASLKELDQSVNFWFRWEIWKLNSTFETRSRSRFFWPLNFYCSIVEFALLLTKEMNWT